MGEVEAEAEAETGQQLPLDPMLLAELQSHLSAHVRSALTHNDAAVRAYLEEQQAFVEEVLATHEAMRATGAAARALGPDWKAQLEAAAARARSSGSGSGRGRGGDGKRA